MHIHLRSLGRPALKGLLDHLKLRGCQGMILILLSLVMVLNILGSPCPASRSAPFFGVGTGERGVWSGEGNNVGLLWQLCKPLGQT